MNACDRAMVRVSTLLVIDWKFAEERSTLLEILRDAIAGSSAGPGLAALADAGRAMLTAEGPVEWEVATRKASRAIATVQRSALLRDVEAMRQEGLVE